MNRPNSPEESGTNTWLTPPWLIEALGTFDFDPCCPPNMPWSTAVRMNHWPPSDGLAVEWRGRVWCNPPYSRPLPWIEKMSEHGHGMMLLPSKSMDARWGQRLLQTSDAVLFLAGRLLFHHVDGTESSGKWSPYCLAAYGEADVFALRTCELDGVLMRRVDRERLT